MDYITDILRDCFSSDLTLPACIWRMLLSMLLGCAVGVERKRKGQTAGIRTFALISMGATLAMLVSIYVPQELMGKNDGDPTRIAAQVVSGIGFLGAGAIIQMKGSVRGLTTAAGIWMVAMIGLAVGCGLYAISVIATLMVMFILILLENIEHRMSMGSFSRTIRLSLPSIVTDIDPYREVLHQHGGQLVNLFVQYDYEKLQTNLNLIILINESASYTKLLDSLGKVYPTDSIAITSQPGF